MRLRRFRRLKRGYYSFILLMGLYLLSFLLPLTMNKRALVVKYEGNYYFPAFKTFFFDNFDDMFGLGTENVYLAKTFDQTHDEKGRQIFGETNYRALQKQFEEAASEDWVLMPLIPYHPNEQFLDPPEIDEDISGNIKRSQTPPFPPSKDHWMGTDDRGRDIGVRLAYGFRISITFALVVVVISYVIGIAVGASLGFFGRWVDMLGQRFVEIWGAIPFLYTVIILAAIFKPSFRLLAFILAAFGWMSISYYIRGEFYREKAKDYVGAAIATGENNFIIMLKHILPNALTPVITFAPFAIVSSIVALVSLDFLGFGLQPPTPSWGELISQSRENIREWHLVVFPLGAMFLTLQLVVFIGEAVREAFDPKVFSRLR